MNSHATIAAVSLAAVLLHCCISNIYNRPHVHGLWPHGKPVSAMTCGRMVVHLLEPYAIRETLFKRKKSAFPAVDDMERTLHEEVMNVCATCRAPLLMLGLDLL